MVDEQSSKRFREMALECQDEAKRALSKDVRERYLHMAQLWLKLADEHDAVEAAKQKWGRVVIATPAARTWRNTSGQGG